jgi:hypothetical protein
MLVAGLLALVLGRNWRAEPEGQLVFDQSEIAAAAAPSQTEMIARFPFQNRSGVPIKILEVKTDCNCTVARPGKDTYAPGERGEIVVNFTFGVRTGVQRKAVVVLTDHPSQPAVPLALIATIPAVLTLPTSLLLWTEDEKPEAKSLVVKASEDPPVRELHAGTDSPFLTVGVQRVSGTEFRVEVTPQPGRRNISAALQIEALLDGNRRKRVSAFVRVR